MVKEKVRNGRQISAHSALCGNCYVPPGFWRLKQLEKGKASRCFRPASRLTIPPIPTWLKGTQGGDKNTYSTRS